MTTLHESNHTGEFLLSEANGNRSRDTAVINATSGKLVSGTIMAVLTAANAGTVTAAAGNTGNGIFGAVTVDSEAVTGTYSVAITEAAAGAGVFSVTDPTGSVVGSGEVAVAFDAGGLSFTIAAGATAFVLGDSWRTEERLVGDGCV